MKNIIYKNSVGIPIDVAVVIEQYNNNWSLKNIAVDIGCSVAQIEKILTNETTRNRPRKYKYNINHDYFKIINTEEKAYIFGFLCADGSLSKKSTSQLTIGLQHLDIDILNKIKIALASTSPIEEYVYLGKKYCRISFYSTPLCDCLKKHGCGVNKTTHLTWADIRIRKNLMRHFLRGYFDGDGCISFSLHKGKYLKGRWNVTSTTAFILGLQKFILDKFGYSGYISQRHKDNPNTKTIELSGNKQITSIMKWLYEDAIIYLHRKQNKYNEYLSLYGK